MRELRYERRLRQWVEGGGGRWESSTYRRAGGETRAYRISPAAPLGVVVAAHGAGNDALFAFSSLFRRLHSAGLEIFTFDLDGHGRFSTTVFSVTGIADALGAAVEHSEALPRGLPLHLLGVSFGGALVVSGAARIPAASAALIATPLRVAASWRTVVRELGPRSIRALWRGRSEYGLTGLIPAFGPLKRSLYPLRQGASAGGGLSYLQALDEALAALRPEEAARAVRVPTLLVYGERDLTAPPAHGERLARALPTSRLRVLPGETHLTTPLAGAAVDAVLEWVELHGAGRSSPAPIVRSESAH